MWLSRIDGIFVSCGCQGLTGYLFHVVVKECWFICLIWLSRIDGIFVSCGCQGLTGYLFHVVVKD